MNLDNLPPEQRAKVLEKARQWRLANYSHVRHVLTTYTREKQEPARPEMPSGAKMFDPLKWTAPNWVWFCEYLSSVLTRRLM